MKKGQKVGMTAVVVALTGCGAWYAFKKMNPNAYWNMKHKMNQMTKDVEKSVENMM